MRQRDVMKRTLLYLLLALVLIFFMTPIFWTILLAIRPTATNRTIPPTLIFSPTLKHFSYAFIYPGLFKGYLMNSLIISGVAVVVSIPFSLSAAYSLSRFRFKGKTFFTFFYLGLFLGPPMVFLLPYYLQMSKLGWVGTYQALIIIYQTFTIPFSILVMKSFFDEVPVSLEEAAMVDGASRFGAVRRVVLPLCLPGIVVSSMFAFVFSWNNSVYPLVLSGAGTRPLPIGTLNLQATTGIQWNAIAGASVTTMIPPMLIFLVLNRYLIRGLTLGAVKQ